MCDDKLKEPRLYVTFKLGDELFAVDVYKAREVLELTHITRLPTAPNYLRGVVNVRGESIPVIDLREKFGMPKARDTRDSRIIVLELQCKGESIVIGGLADSVHEVIELEYGAINESPSIGMQWRTDLILGIGKSRDRFIILLDIEKMLMDEAPVATMKTEALSGNLQS